MATKAKGLPAVARRLNEQHERFAAGFYWSTGRGGRYFQARVREGKLEVHDWEKWFVVPEDQIKFHDHNGRDIVLPL